MDQADFNNSIIIEIEVELVKEDLTSSRPNFNHLQNIKRPSIAKEARS